MHVHDYDEGLFFRIFKRLTTLPILLMLIAFFVSGCDEVVITPLPKTVPAEFSMNNHQVRLIFGGDVMMSREVGLFIENEKNGDYTFLTETIADVFRSADLSFVNLENVISDLGEELKTKIGPKFRADPTSVNALVDAGIDLVSIANNHAFDYGKIAFQDSINTLRANNLMDLGGGFNEQEAYDPVVCTFRSKNDDDSVSIAFISFTRVGLPVWEAQGDNTGVAWLTDETLETGIDKARSMADLVIVSFHFGTENESEPTNTNQLYFAHRAVDLGADLVVGHHPHVIQPVEIYQGKYIAFSLGNLIFDMTDEINRHGMVLAVTIEEKSISDVQTMTYRINDEFQPVMDETP
ncbi:MAG: CapA family protein [Proteobacteria bacterium]|nr:CapA family protein [Pseudomonadota bacterium]